MSIRSIAKMMMVCTILLCLPSDAFSFSFKKWKKAATPPVFLMHPSLTPEVKVSVLPLLQPQGELKLCDTISITFIGDVMQHGKQLLGALKEGSDPDNPYSYDYSLVFKHIKEKLQKADLAVANMEFPLGTPPYTGYPVFSAPESIAWEAKESGIDLFLLANNHIMDKGKRGFLNTLDVYEEMDGKYIGAYRNREEEKQLNPVFYNIKGIRVAVFNFTYGTNGIPVVEPCVVNMMDSLHVKECIRRAKKMGADIIIGAPHWGEEYQLKPSGQQRKWAGMMQREGVGVIVGGHPHVPQSAEISRNSILFYSLGNYISNQTTPDYTQLELMVTIKIRKNFITGETSLLEPEYEFLWCFKKGEFADDYTVVPVKELLGKEEKVKDKTQYHRMVDTYYRFLEQGLIKNMY